MSMFTSKGTTPSIVSESKRRAQLEKALQEERGQHFLTFAVSSQQSVRSIIEQSHIRIEKAVQASGRVPRRKVGQSVRTYLLDTVSRRFKALSCQNIVIGCRRMCSYTTGNVRARNLNFG